MRPLSASHNQGLSRSGTNQASLALQGTLVELVSASTCVLCQVSIGLALDPVVVGLTRPGPTLRLLWVRTPHLAASIPPRLCLAPEQRRRSVRYVTVSTARHLRSQVRNLV
jgi:hypothetical protein